MLAIGAVSGGLLSLDSTLSGAFGGEVLTLRLKVAQMNGTARSIFRFSTGNYGSGSARDSSAE